MDAEEEFLSCRELRRRDTYTPEEAIKLHFL